MAETTAPTTAALPFAVEEYVPPTPAAPAHTELVQQMIDMGADKVAKFVFPTEDAALSALKSWQSAARFLKVAVKRVSLTAEGKGKDAQVALRVRIGEQVTRNRKPAAPENVETPAEASAE